MLTSLLKYRSK